MKESLGSCNIATKMMKERASMGDNVKTWMRQNLFWAVWLTVPNISYPMMGLMIQDSKVKEKMWIYSNTKLRQVKQFQIWANPTIDPVRMNEQSKLNCALEISPRWPISVWTRLEKIKHFLRHCLLQCIWKGYADKILLPFTQTCWDLFKAFT